MSTHPNILLVLDVFPQGAFFISSSTLPSRHSSVQQLPAQAQSCRPMRFPSNKYLASESPWLRMFVRLAFEGLACCG